MFLSSIPKLFHIARTGIKWGNCTWDIHIVDQGIKLLVSLYFVGNQPYIRYYKASDHSITSTCFEGSKI